MTEFDSVTVISMRGILSNLSASQSQLALVALPKGCQAGSNTWAAIWHVLAWSLSALADGKHPSKQPNGEDWPMGHPRRLLAGKKISAAVVSVIAGDIEWFCQEFQFPYAMSNYPCAYCMCDNKTPPGPCPFNDFRKDAPWKSRYLSHHDLFNTYKHALFDMVPGVNVYTVKLDILHVMDLGVSCH
eukprot:2232820-Pyramimonas_sp.AAC.1